VPMSGSRRALTTLVDQGFSSISNFGVGVAVARAAGARGLGAFALAYAGWLMLAAMHRSLVTEPMAIEGDATSTRSTDGLRRGLAAEILLGLTATAIFVVVGLVVRLAGAGLVSTALLALAPWLTVLVVQDYWRWVGFMRLQPERALINDTVFNGAMLAALLVVFARHSHSVVALISAWGLGGLAGALFGLRQYRVLPSLRHGFALLRARWSVGKWLAGMSVTDWGAQQGYLFIVGAILGPAGLGSLKAAQMLVAGPCGVLIQAGGSLGLPEATRAYADKGWHGLMTVTRFVTVASFVSLASVAAVVVLWGDQLLRAIYGPSFAHLHVAAVLISIGFIIIAFDLGPILVLKATRNTRWVFYVELVFLTASLTSVTALSLAYGINGAAAATIVTYLVTMSWCRWLQHRVHRSIAEDRVVTLVGRRTGAQPQPDLVVAAAANSG
jgi:O-antigen/teichoic acid export membrane protein